MNFKTLFFSWFKVISLDDPSCSFFVFFYFEQHRKKVFVLKNIGRSLKQWPSLDRRERLGDVRRGERGGLEEV